MKSKSTPKDVSQNEYTDLLNRVDICEVSKASVEIMLERFCNGSEIDFPFSQ